MRRAEVEHREFISTDGIETVSVTVKEPALIEQHQHDISHLTVVVAGSMIPIVDKQQLPKLSAGDHMVVEAHKTHCFWTLEPNTKFLCITNTLGNLVHADKHRVLSLKE